MYAKSDVDSTSTNPVDPESFMEYILTNITDIENGKLCSASDILGVKPGGKVEDYLANLKAHVLGNVWTPRNADILWNTGRLIKSTINYLMKMPFFVIWMVSDSLHIII